jgi:hypothetical protein
MYICNASRREPYITCSDEHGDNIHKYFVMWLPGTPNKGVKIKACSTRWAGPGRMFEETKAGSHGSFVIDDFNN